MYLIILRKKNKAQTKLKKKLVIVKETKEFQVSFWRNTVPN